MLTLPPYFMTLRLFLADFGSLGRPSTRTTLDAIIYYSQMRMRKKDATYDRKGGDHVFGDVAVYVYQYFGTPTFRCRSRFTQAKIIQGTLYCLNYR
jgi:hypothetical protein